MVGWNRTSHMIPNETQLGEEHASFLCCNYSHQKGIPIFQSGSQSPAVSSLVFLVHLPVKGEGKKREGGGDFMKRIQF